jgi:poly(3-hydroxybutyrate) depolymerase
MHLLHLLAGALTTGAMSAAGDASTEILRRQTEGCGKTHYFNGITQYHDIQSSERERKYSIHLPADYDKTKPYPLVLGFHGSESIGLWFELDAKMSEERFSASVSYRFYKHRV